MKLPFYDLEGALMGKREIEHLRADYLIPVTHHDGRWGIRRFRANRRGEFHQVSPTEWREPPEMYTVAENIRLIQDSALPDD